MVEPGTGNIIAMTQNRTWGTSGVGKTTYNYNTDRSMGGTIGMQAGSTFKIFTLAAALEAGISPYEPINSPSPATFEGFVNCDTGVPFPHRHRQQLHHEWLLDHGAGNRVLHQHLLHGHRRANGYLPSRGDRRIDGGLHRQR